MDSMSIVKLVIAGVALIAVTVGGIRAIVGFSRMSAAARRRSAAEADRKKRIAVELPRFKSGHGAFWGVTRHIDELEKELQHVIYWHADHKTAATASMKRGLSQLRDDVNYAVALGQSDSDWGEVIRRRVTGGAS